MAYKNPTANDLADFADDFVPLADQIVSLSPDKYYTPVFRHPLSFYRERVQMTGCSSFSKVLDAGHGFGQWAIALAEVNRHVVGVDHNGPRCQISELLKAHFRATNLDVMQKPLSEIDGVFQPGAFDLIWCWGVIMFVDRGSTLATFNRLLAPGGVLFLGSVNTPRRWLYKAAKGWRDGIRNRNFYRTCWRGYIGVNAQKGVSAFTLRGSATVAERYGFVQEATGYDGAIDISSHRERPFEPELVQWLHNIEMKWRKVRDL